MCQGSYAAGRTSAVMPWMWSPRHNVATLVDFLGATLVDGTNPEPGSLSHYLQGFIMFYTSEVSAINWDIILSTEQDFRDLNGLKMMLVNHSPASIFSMVGWLNGWMWKVFTVSSMLGLSNCLIQYLKWIHGRKVKWWSSHFFWNRDKNLIGGADIDLELMTSDIHVYANGSP